MCICRDIDDVVESHCVGRCFGSTGKVVQLGCHDFSFSTWGKAVEDRVTAWCTKHIS